ncbi:MAG: hypothetical protein VXY83_05820 [Pseudomonadota bacterium]|nr:hypothetical protein [Magnetococcales bacterium]MEC8467861.1 hypothetical protein [Pseudomonadota bacterium]|tara:strand:- start:18481 stop:18852 length:372 start_codon:yes stop_codon:yes gene_type:complete
MITVYAFALSALGMAGVYLGIAFLNGFLFPSVFGGLYALTDNVVLRIIAAFPLFFGPSNYLIGKAYEIGGATIGGVGTVIFTVIWMTLMAIIVDQAKVNLWVISGAMVAIFGCLMVVHGIKGF